MFPLLLLLDSVVLRDLVCLRDHVHLARTMLAHLLLVALNLRLLGLKLGHLPVLLLLHQLLLKLLLLLAALRLLFARSTTWLAVCHILGRLLLLRSALAKVLGLVDRELLRHGLGLLRSCYVWVLGDTRLLLWHRYSVVVNTLTLVILLMAQVLVLRLRVWRLLVGHLS